MANPNSTNSESDSVVRAKSGSDGLARNWWAIAIRATLAAGFAIGIFWGPAHTFAALVVIFAIYVAADGLAAIVAGLFRIRRRELWRSLVFEGALNLFFSTAVLVWPAIAATAFVSLASIWAVATGALLLAAARRTPESYIQGLLALVGLVSIVWGVLISIVGSSSDGAANTFAGWLMGYLLCFAVALVVLSGVLRHQHRRSKTEF
ncbi:MAG: HdeD family acid-resistance protein [Bradyrhizobium sp.]|jgi:uncharacterized membrane protein HdeD (DUF308 family)|uniref:HdeD family acid-resistance protein n=1 Tax=Bradyrhizobium TaxID=374 RepID=UPI001551C7D1|nr:DUF308 domain-containing protein [Bradyrhizobium sp. LMG 8443]NPU25267.1 HdeD family acid-resistance protein [Bradyrhizobium sp. LMG 8443]